MAAAADLRTSPAALGGDGGDVNGADTHAAQHNEGFTLGAVAATARIRAPVPPRPDTSNDDGRVRDADAEDDSARPSAMQVPEQESATLGSQGPPTATEPRALKIHHSISENTPGGHGRLRAGKPPGSPRAHNAALEGIEGKGFDDIRLAWGLSLHVPVTTTMTDAPITNTPQATPPGTGFPVGAGPTRALGLTVGHLEEGKKSRRNGDGRAGWSAEARRRTPTAIANSGAAARLAAIDHERDEGRTVRGRDAGSAKGRLGDAPDRMGDGT